MVVDAVGQSNTCTELFSVEGVGDEGVGLGGFPQVELAGGFGDSWSV